MGYFDLDRRFVEREDYNQSELVFARVGHKHVGWDAVLQQRSSLVVAPANFGKTTEMQQQAQRLRSAGRSAVFVALRRLANRPSLAKALATEERDALNAWRAQPTAVLTMFVDSLDEAAAGTLEHIEDRLSDLADELAWPNDRVRWVVSTRPAMLTAEVFQELTALLTKSPGKAVIGSPEEKEKSRTQSASSDPYKLTLYSMAPLSGRQALAYLSGKYPAVDSQQLLALADERGLSGFVESPGGLDLLARIDMVSNPPNCLTEVFERVVSAMEGKLGEDRRLIDAGVLAHGDLSTAAQRIAAASQVCQRVNIEMSDSVMVTPPDAISARVITASLLSEAATRLLLGTQLFVDVGFHQVKMYPDELSPYLAAKRLSSLVESLAQAERLLDNFTWTAPSGEQGVQSAYLPMTGWLATLNPHCREVVLRKDPQALAFFGDLRNPAVPLSAAQEALTQSVERLVQRGDRPGRGAFTLTSENHWQAGPARLASTIAALYSQYHKDHWAREVLTDIATVCKLDALRSEVLARHGNDIRKLLADSSDVEFLLTLERPEDISAIGAAVLSGLDVGESILRILMRRTGWRHFSPTEWAKVLDKRFAQGPGGFYLAYALKSEDLLASATADQLAQLARGLVVRLARRSPKLDGRRSSDGGHHADLIAVILSELARRTSLGGAARFCRIYQVFRRDIDKAYLQSSDIEALSAVVSNNCHIRMTLLKAVVRKNLSDNEMWSHVYLSRRLAEFTDQDIAAIDSPQLKRIEAEREAQRRRSPVPAPEKPQQRQQSKLTVSASRKKSLLNALPSLRDGTNASELAWIASWLLRANSAPRYGEVSFDLFEAAVGPEISGATREGLSRLWRDKPARFDEDEPNSTYHISAAGLQGLHLELGNGSKLPTLSDAEARQALRYGLIEINGYPKWFWPLAETNPAVAVPELVAIARGASQGAASKAHAEDLLASVSGAPAAVREALARPAWDHLIASNGLQQSIVGRLLDAALSCPGKVPQNDFKEAALRKMMDAYSAPIACTPDAKLLSLRSEALTWAAHWLRYAPLTFRDAIAEWKSNDADDVKKFVFDLAAEFGRDREGIAAVVARTGDGGVEAMEDLFLLTRWAVDPARDPIHPPGVAFSPNPHDNAARFRSIILDAIAGTNTQAGYESLGRIAKSLPPGDAYVDYVRRSQFGLRERQFLRDPLAQTNYERFEREFRGDVTGSISFAMAVESDLRAVRYDLEQGEHSLRRFFSSIDFRRINRADQDGEKAGLALEADFQRLLASELHHHARGRYSVTLEPETAEGKRRDVLCSHRDWRASIELKMSERWTVDQYMVALEQQLVGQYMRHRNATVGFLMIVLQKKSRRWIDPSTGAELTFQDLLAMLVVRAQTLEAEDRTLYLRVIGIDATEPEDFRAAERVGSRC